MKDNNSSCQERHVLVINDGKRRAIALEAAAYSIGRDASNAIVLNADTVSRQHAMLLRVPIPGTRQYRYRILDGNSQGKPSANGVFVNGQSCRSQEIGNGDVVRFGQTIEGSYLTVSMGDAEFINYLESISYQSLKTDTMNAKATLVSDDFLSDEDIASVAAVQTISGDAQQTSVSSRQRSTVVPWTEAMQQTPDPKATSREKRHPYRLWMMVVPSLLLIGTITVGIWSMSKGHPAKSSAQEPSPVETAKPATP
jgi:pSer/pThr/pTyr-binding forkhead associated (FHA) protein